MVDVGLLAEQRRYARRKAAPRDVGVKAEKRRTRRRRAPPPRDVLPELRKAALRERTVKRKEKMVAEYVKQYPETRGVYDVGEGYVAVITPRGTRVIPEYQYERLTPEQLLRLGAISREEYGRYQKRKERAFLEWERVAYPKWAAEYEKRKTRELESAFRRWELGTSIYEMLAKEDPWKAMRFGVEMGFFTQAEFDAWARRVTAGQEAVFRRWDVKPPAPSWETSITGEILGPQTWKELGGVPHSTDWERLQKVHLRTWEKRYEYQTEAMRGVAAGFTGTFEALFRGDIPTPSGALISTVLTVHPKEGAPFWEWKYQLHPPKTTPQLKELLGMGPAYVFGGVLGELTQAWLLGKGLGYLGKGIAKGLGRLGRTKPGTKVLKTLQPARVHPLKKLEALKWRMPEFLQRRLWPVEYGRRQIEKSISWGEDIFMWTPGAELSETLKPAWKFTGYPVIRGEKAGFKIIQVVTPKWWERLLRDGGLLVSVAEKPTATVGWEQARYLALAFTKAPAKAGTLIVPFPKPQLAPPPKIQPFPWEREKFRPLKLIKPKPKHRKKQPLFPGLKPFELERIKFHPLELLEPEVGQREKLAPAPKVAQMPKQAQIQVPKLEVPQVQWPKIDWPPPPPPPPTPPFPPFAFKWPPKLRQPREGGFLAGWFKRVHPIAEPKEVMRALGVAPPRRAKRRARKPRKTTRKTKKTKKKAPRKRVRRRRRKRGGEVNWI